MQPHAPSRDYRKKTGETLPNVGKVDKKHKHTDTRNGTKKKKRIGKVKKILEQKIEKTKTQIELKYF